MTRLDERVALVTGASRGVGRGVALGSTRRAAPCARAAAR